MPTASGATGRLDAGVDASTTRMPNGLKKNPRPANRNCDSYLQIYQEQKKRNKVNVLPNVPEPVPSVQQEDEVAKEKIAHTDCSTKDQTSGKESSGEKSKKSQLCVLL